MAQLHLRRREPDRLRAATRTRWSSARRSSTPSSRRSTCYILPKHIWEKQDAKAITKYDALDGVGSGPFTLEKFEKGQFARFKANPNYYGGKPAVDRVVLRNFDNPDAMVAALKRGEIDAAEDVPGTRVPPAREGPEHRHRRRATRAR